MKKNACYSLFSNALFLNLFFFVGFVAYAQEEGEQSKISDTDVVYQTRVIEIIGTTIDAAQTPGATLVIENKQESLTQALEKAPGVHLRNEDPVGLIPNIGFRGLNPNRSEKILFLEDGLPIGLAPYNENAAYFLPPFERMDRAEVLKGSGSILYGPQTIGGVVNLINRPIAAKERINVGLQYGSFDFLFAKANYSKSFGKFGFDSHVIYKQGGGFRENSDFHFVNLYQRLAYQFDSKNSLRLTVSYHDQFSYQTYLGLTESLYQGSPEINPAKNDTFDVNHLALRLSYTHFFSDDVELTTQAYFTKAKRDWDRQDFSRNTLGEDSPDNTVTTLGNPALAGDAIYLLESFGSRNRSFYYSGIEPRLIADYSLFGRQHNLHVGMRFHWEKMKNERQNRTSYLANPTTRDLDDRITLAYAFFAQNSFEVTERLHLIPGLRLEVFDQKRKIKILQNEAVDQSGNDFQFVFIPGFGITYEIFDQTTAFFGVHRGFAPPRTSQAITSDGQDANLDPEYSFNYELGIKSYPKKWLYGELSLFLLDFENQVIPATESGGVSAAEINAGQSRHLGFEIALGFDFIQALHSQSKHQLTLNTGYTFTDTKNTTTNGIFNGNELVYAPKHLWDGELKFVIGDGFLNGLEVALNASYTSSQFADLANTQASTLDGTNGKIDAYWLLGAKMSYPLPKTNFRLSLTGENLLDKKYIVSRAPRGIFPGAGLSVVAGIEFLQGE